MVQAKLRTPRLELAPLTSEHKSSLRELDTDPNVMRYIFAGKPLTDEESTMVFDHLSKISEENDGLGCWVGHKGDEFVGWWVLAPAESTGDSNEMERRDSTASTSSTTSSRVELGMRVAPKFQGQGFAKEGLQTLLKHSFEDLGAEEVYGETMAVNEGSRATMARCGLKHVRTWHNKYEDFTPPEGIEEGEVEYKITKSDWQD